MTVVRVMRTAASTGLTLWGAALLVAPDPTVRTVTGSRVVPPAPVVRVLGARRIVQQALVTVTSAPLVAWLAVTTDVLHAGSMVAAARIWPQYRRAELTSAGIAAGSAALTALVAWDRSRERR